MGPHFYLRKSTYIVYKKLETFNFYWRSSERFGYDGFFGGPITFRVGIAVAHCNNSDYLFAPILLLFDRIRCDSARRGVVMQRYGFGKLLEHSSVISNTSDLFSGLLEACLQIFCSR